MADERERKIEELTKKWMGEYAINRSIGIDDLLVLAMREMADFQREQDAKITMDEAAKRVPPVSSFLKDVAAAIRGGSHE